MLPAIIKTDKVKLSIGTDHWEKFKATLPLWKFYYTFLRHGGVGNIKSLKTFLKLTKIGSCQCSKMLWHWESFSTLFHQWIFPVSLDSCMVRVPRLARQWVNMILSQNLIFILCKTFDIGEAVFLFNSVAVFAIHHAGYIYVPADLDSIDEINSLPILFSWSELVWLAYDIDFVCLVCFNWNKLKQTKHSKSTSYASPTN